MVKRKKEKTRAKTRVHHFYTRRLTYLSFAWFQSWRPFWSYPLPVKSSTVADPLLFFIFFLSNNVCLVCKKCRKLQTLVKAIDFCFFSLPRLSKFFFLLAKRKSDKKSRWKQGTCFHFLPRRRRIIIIIIIIEIIII